MDGVQQRTAGQFSTIFAFDVKDGAKPYGSLIDVAGTLYGTTEYGGKGSCKDGSARGCGTVFAIAPTGTERVVHSFEGSPNDGAYPHAGLLNIDGTFYGVTRAYGGATGERGSIFAVTPNGKESVIYNFKGGSDGQDPVGQLTTLGRTLYGTTESGGRDGDGTIFSSTRGGGESVVHSFDGKDGEAPMAGLLALRGMLYGTTDAGGHGSGDGTVFQASTTGTERVVFTFDHGRNGAFPYGGLAAAGGSLYGTTYEGGDHSRGEIFVVGPTGSHKMLYSFKGTDDGAGPVGNLTYYEGALYGVTQAGGGNDSCYILYGYFGCGTIYKVTTSGVETVLYRFTGGSDGQYPYGTLLAAHGILFGTTSAGGKNKRSCVSAYGGPGCGTVYKLTL